MDRGRVALRAGLEAVKRDEKRPVVQSVGNLLYRVILAYVSVKYVPKCVLSTNTNSITIGSVEKSNSLHGS
jgi:hypothetical protein